MNSLVEILNQWGGNFLNFAWPMLWQSSLLIAALFAVEFLFRRRLRASIRYALWLVVLVKLCVPPTLALPTSPVWWLHQTSPVVTKTKIPHYTVAYDQAPLLELPQAPLPAYVPPKPAMTVAAWLLVSSTSISLALLLWLLVRWWQIARQVRRSSTCGRLTVALAEARSLAGIRFKPQIKLTANSMSPAVCGLFRPAILVPKALAENFSDEQLRAVLLHELIHLRRRDVWLNFLQALLQIAYWWHPLVWLANARIRRVREEAVDDAVMLALRDEAESYAPTLLEVAKLALNRPLVSLGLVGILESRHSLRQRIERLVDFRPPRQAGLTLVSLLGILAFTAVAVPMGSAPSPGERETPPVAVSSAAPHILPETNLPAVLITGFIYQMGPAKFEKVVSDLKFNPANTRTDPWWSASPEKFHVLVERLKSSGFQLITQPRIQTASGRPAMMYVGDITNGIEFDCTPFVIGGQVDLSIQGRMVGAKASGPFTNQFNAKASVENNGGIVIRTKNVGGFGESNVVIIAGFQLVTNLVASGNERANLPPKTLKTMTFKLVRPVGQDELKELLRAAGVKIPTTAYFYLDSGILLVRGSVEQLALVDRVVLKLNGYSAEEIENGNSDFVKSIATSSAARASTNLVMRTFKVDPDVFSAALRNIPGLQTNSLSAMARSLFTQLGVDFKSPKEKSVFYNDKPGLLFVKATESDLDTIERAIQALNQISPTVQRNHALPQSGSNSTPASATIVTGILSDANFNVVMQALRQRTVVETLKEPEVRTVSGRAVNVMDPNVLLATQRKMTSNSSVLQNTDPPLPEIHIKARFVEVPEVIFDDASETFFSGAIPNSFPAGVTNGIGILTASEAKGFLQQLELQKGSEILAEPEATTTSGRQTQMRATQIITVITNAVFEKNPTNHAGSISYQAGQMETGPVLDTVTKVLPDGYTIDLRTIASVATFYGYATPPTNMPPHSVTNSAGEIVDLPVVLPVVQVSRAAAHTMLFDGQTLILFPKAEAPIAFNPDEKMKEIALGQISESEKKNGNKKLVVLVTVTVVDPAGNRVHTDDEMSFAQKGIPPQSPQPR